MIHWFGRWWDVVIVAVVVTVVSAGLIWWPVPSSAEWRNGQTVLLLCYQGPHWSGVIVYVAGPDKDAALYERVCGDAP
jgi:hypothetical protein